MLRLLIAVGLVAAVPSAALACLDPVDLGAVPMTTGVRITENLLGSVGCSAPVSAGWNQ